jgi:hypothetical protein
LKPGSPLEVTAAVTPEPIVGQEVTWHIEMKSLGNLPLPNTTLSVTLPVEVELVSGPADWHGDIPSSGVVSVDLLIRVTTPGEWPIHAYAYADLGSGNVYGGSKLLYLVSSIDSAIVVEDLQTPTPAPSLMIAPTNTPPTISTAIP